MSTTDPPPKTLPCKGCDRCVPGRAKVLGPPHAPWEGDCGICWLWYHSPPHREEWGGDPGEVTPVEFTRPPRPDWLATGGGTHGGTRSRPGPVQRFSPPEPRPTCRHLGTYTSRQCQCIECGPGRRQKVFECRLFKHCTVGKPCDPGEVAACCRDCNDWEPLPESMSAGSAAEFLGEGMARGEDGRAGLEDNVNKPVTWAYGVTTVPERQETVLPRTLESLARAGFDGPRLFVDGADGKYHYAARWPGLEVTARHPRLGVHGNWVLSLYELYVRNPACHRYALFQDDLVTCRNLRDYLDRCPVPDNGYWNLYTFPQNEALAAPGQVGWYPSNQLGLGAVALVFSREVAVTLLSSRSFTERPMTPDRGTRNVDGGIVTALSDRHNGLPGWREYVHSPSLVQHTGLETTVFWRDGRGNKPHPPSATFRGEDYDAREMIASIPARQAVQS